MKKRKKYNIVSLCKPIVDKSVEIGKNVTIYAGAVLLGKTKIGDNCVVFSNTVIKDSTIGNNCVVNAGNQIFCSQIAKDCTLLPNNFVQDCVVEKDVKISFSHCKGADIKCGASIGPFARLRENSVVGKNALVGDFVEIKNASLGEGTKASHLAYVGDAQIGRDCNIGCGAIFVNYNGKIKQRSVVEGNCFLGSNCNVIAPVHIAKNTYICAGTTITKDVDENEFVIGRATQQAKPNKAKNYLSKML